MKQPEQNNVEVICPVCMEAPGNVYNIIYRHPFTVAPIASALSV